MPPTWDDTLGATLHAVPERRRVGLLFTLGNDSQGWWGVTSESSVRPSVGTATVMFTDLVGSTALRSRVGEVAADVVRGIHDGTLIEAVDSNDGRIVKHLGDGVMATFGSSANAVAAAVAIQQAIDVANRRGVGERLQLRIGLSVGDVTWEGDDCFGSRSSRPNASRRRLTRRRYGVLSW